MEKDRFVSLVRNYTALTKDDTSELIALTDRFPYSQILHLLSSRGAQDANLPGQQELLHKTAIYSTERSVLKSVMTARKSAPAVSTPVKAVTTKTQQITAVETVVVESNPVAEVAIVPSVSPSGDSLRSNVEQDINDLHAAMQRYQQTIDMLEKGIVPEPIDQKKKAKKTAEPPEQTDTFIEEIRTTKKKVKPDGPKQKEQIEIIENFIKTQPSISRNKNVPPVSDGSDLAEKSLVYGDNIVSETLVEILLKQGKKDKAIEVLKKLIWKIPQKKAYFAAQIEELKK